MKNYEGKYIVRATDAGVFYGDIKQREGNVVTMTNVRKLWYWDGASAVEQIALEGVKKPDNCKFTVTVDEMEIFDPTQIIRCTDAAIASIEAVREWRQ